MTSVHKEYLYKDDFDAILDIIDSYLLKYGD